MRYKERDEQKRAVFLEEISAYPEDERVFVDESGIDSYFHQLYGWAEKGKQVFGEVCGKRFARESFIAAKTGTKVFAPLCFQGTCNTKLFNAWVEQFLVPELTSGQIVVMDNATFHKSEETRLLIEKAGCKLLFLPQYSPDLNPIEKYWAFFKAKVRSLIHKFTNLSDVIDYVFNM